jgi:hypothetical protein
MSEFEAVLRSRVEESQRAVLTAGEAGDDDHTRALAGRLAELLALADRYGVDTSAWVDLAVRSFAARWS